MNAPNQLKQEDNILCVQFNTTRFKEIVTTEVARNVARVETTRVRDLNLICSRVLAMQQPRYIKHTNTV